MVKKLLEEIASGGRLLGEIMVNLIEERNILILMGNIMWNVSL